MNNIHFIAYFIYINIIKNTENMIAHVLEIQLIYINVNSY